MRNNSIARCCALPTPIDPNVGQALSRCSEKNEIGLRAVHQRGPIRRPLGGNVHTDGLAAPGRFSMNTGCPSLSCRCWLNERAKVSIMPPGVLGTMKRMGFVGQGACACATVATQKNAAERSNSWNLRITPSQFTSGFNHTTPGRMTNAWKAQVMRYNTDGLYRHKNLFQSTTRDPS